jgi:Sulfotransferase domain
MLADGGAASGREDFMGLQVIGAGVGRTATFSLKFALEHLGLGPCYHMAEVFARARTSIPQWIAVANGRPDWDAIFDGFRSTTDYPACSHWRELADRYPNAKVVLTVRDADSWFDSVSETIFSERMMASLAGSPAEEMLRGNIFNAFDGRVRDRAFMTGWFARRNQAVIDALPAGRLLVYSPKEGWEPLCAFLGVPVPAGPFPRVNSRDELGQASEQEGGLPADPEAAERFGRDYIEQLRIKAFRR